MATYTTTAMGPNSWVIGVPAGYDYGILIDDVSEVITTNTSWELTYTSGTNRHFRTLHKTEADTSFYKGVKLLAASNLIYMYGFEKAANVSTTTNVTSATFSTTLNTANGGHLYVFADDGYLVICTRDNATGSFGWVGNFEYTNASNTTFGSGASDTANRTFVTSDVMFNIGQGSAPSLPMLNGSKYTSPALLYWQCCTTFGFWGAYGQGSAVQAMSATTCPLPESNAINGLPYASDIALQSAEVNITTPCGMLYGLKALNKNAGGHLDTVDIKVDADGFCSNTGTNAEYFVLYAGDFPGNQGCLAIPR